MISTYWLFDLAAVCVWHSATVMKECGSVECTDKGSVLQWSCLASDGGKQGGAAAPGRRRQDPVAAGALRLR